VTAFGKLRIVVEIRPAFYVLALLVLAGSVGLASLLGKTADIVIERGVTGPGTITIVRSNLLGRTDTHTFDLSRVQSIEMCEGGPTSIIPSVREGKPVIFCSLVIVLRDSASVSVGSWEPYPFQDAVHVLAARDSLSRFAESRLPGRVEARIGGFTGAIAVAVFALFFGLVHLRLFFMTKLTITVRPEAAGASVMTRLRRPGFQPAQKQVHYVPMGWVTAVRTGRSSGVVVEYSNGPEVRIPLPPMSDRTLIRARLFLEDMMMTYVRTTKGN
jgi:hypothetical protein